MRYTKLLLSTSLVSTLFLTGCGSDNPTVQNTNSQNQLVSKKEKKMSLQNPMLKEIYNVRITDITTQRADVSRIVLEYIPLNIQKDKLLKLISEDFNIIENSDYKLFAHHSQGEGHLGKRRDIYIEFYFDGEKKLNSISAYLDKSNNL